jgi:hypothetical protein
VANQHRLVRHCPRCRRSQRFECAHRFRVNANGKLVDVWLLFDCERCGSTAKLPVLERVPVSRIGRVRLDAFARNDPGLAAALAGDAALLKRGGFRIERAPAP